MKKNNIICLIILFIFSIPALAEKHYTLEQLVTLAQKSNLLLKISQLDKNIALEDYRDARALPNPELEYSRGRGELPGEPAKPRIWGVGLKWSVPNPIYRYFSLKSLETDVTAAEIEGEIKKKDIIKGLKSHYYRLQFYKKTKIFLEEKLRRLNEVNRITKAKVLIGESKEIDALRSSVEIQENKTRIFQIRKFILSERTKINEFLAYTLPADFVTGGDLPFTPLADTEKRIHTLIDSSPFILLKANRLEKEKEHLKAVRFSIIQSVEFFGEREKEMEGKLWKVGVGVSIPLFNRKTAQTRKAKYQKEKARLEFEHAKKHFFADIQRMVSEIRVLEKEIETFKGAVLEEGRVNMELSERLYKEGEVPLVVFLDSQDSFFEIEKRYYEAITEWNILKAGLEALLGEEL